MKLERFLKFRKHVEVLQRRADRAQGALEELEEQLRRDFNCATVEEALKLMTSMKEEEQALQAQADKQLAEFNEKWQGVFEES